MPLLITDPAAREPRGTEDADVLIELASRAAYYQLNAALLRLGFRNDPQGPVCRYAHPPLVLDVMATDPSVLGFTNRWYDTAVRTSRVQSLPNGLDVRVVTPAVFLATKLEAFDSSTRANAGDLRASHDFEDVVVLLDGRPTICEDVRRDDADAASFLRTRFAALLAEPHLEEAVEGHLEPNDAGRLRLPIVLERMREIAETNP